MQQVQTLSAEQVVYQSHQIAGEAVNELEKAVIHANEDRHNTDRLIHALSLSNETVETLENNVRFYKRLAIGTSIAAAASTCSFAAWYLANHCK